MLIQTFNLLVPSNNNGKEETQYQRKRNGEEAKSRLPNSMENEDANSFLWICMKNLIFLLWLLLYPIAFQTAEYIFAKQRILKGMSFEESSETELGLSYLIVFVFYLFIATKLYET